MDLAQTIITIASVITALGVIFGVVFTIYRWYLKNEKQDDSIKEIKAEQSILTKGVLACLKGLHEQGCNGPVTHAIEEIEEHINKQAHKQEVFKMNEILLNVLSVLLTAVILPLISIAGTQLVKFINSKIKNNELAKQLTTATSIVTNAVRVVFQTYVDTLKKNGSFDKEAQAEALTRAKNIALSQITEDTKSYIEDNYGDFNNWLTIQIEATIDLLKNS